MLKHSNSIRNLYTISRRKWHDTKIQCNDSAKYENAHRVVCGEYTAGLRGWKHFLAAAFAVCV